MMYEAMIFLCVGERSMVLVYVTTKLRSREDRKGLRRFPKMLHFGLGDLIWCHKIFHHGIFHQHKVNAHKDLTDA